MGGKADPTAEGRLRPRPSVTHRGIADATVVQQEPAQGLTRSRIRVRLARRNGRPELKRRGNLGVLEADRAEQPLARSPLRLDGLCQDRRELDRRVEKVVCTVGFNRRRARPALGRLDLAGSRIR